MNYSHKQLGTNLLIVMAFVSVIILLLGLSQNVYILLPSIIILGLVSFLFHSLNIQVSDKTINWSFGPGFWKKSLKIESVLSVKEIKKQWYYGLGIRIISTGWLYAVSGPIAIEIELKNGSKVNLGTNDAQNLIQAIKTNLEKYLA